MRNLKFSKKHNVRNPKPAGAPKVPKVVKPVKAAPVKVAPPKTVPAAKAAPVKAAPAAKPAPKKYLSFFLNLIDQIV